MNYSFYGYYPHSTSVPGSTAALDVTNTVVSVTYAFDGTQDIIYGSAVATEANGFDGFNARYIRKNPNTKPEITFTHKLTRLQFNILAAGTTDEEKETAANLRITAIKIIKVPTTLTLIVANKTNPTENGNLTFTPWQEGDAESAYILKNQDDTNATEVTPENPAVTMGSFMMLPATATQPDGEYIALIDMSLVKDGDTKKLPTSTVPIKLNNNATFVAGTSYKVNLSVYGLSTITIEATLTEWIQGGDDADIEIN